MAPATGYATTLMKPETSLRRTVLNALIASTIFTGLVFIAVALATIHLVEQQLASQDLGRDMERILEEIQHDEAPSLERGMLLFSGSSSNPPPMPDELQDRPMVFTLSSTRVSVITH